jgi:2-methylcitrate dehydratase PrpD
VIGGEPLAAPWAALVNGTAAHALDYDDVLDPAMSHPSAALVPAILALAETEGSSGADALDAFLVGYEVLARLGEAMNLVHYQRGWHTTLSLGSMGVAAACGRLLRLDADGIAMAISLATSMAGGSKRQFGTMAKPLHAGLAAKNGLMAAQLAASGVTGVAEPLEGRWGYIDLMAGPAAPGLAGALAHLGDPPAMEQYGVWAKAYPCCASTHRPADALRAMNLRTQDVVSIDALVSEAAAANLRYRIPTDPNEARFSLPYCLAAVLTDGTLSVASFTAEAIARPALRPLMERVTMRVDPELTADRPVTESFERGTLDVLLTDGTRRQGAVLAPRGHPKAPLSDAELEAKFRDCAAHALSPRGVDTTLARLSRFGDLARVSELTEVLSPRTR